MIAGEPTRTTVKRLKKAGFTPRDAKGSHTMYTCQHERVSVPIADGHRETSPGVVRKVLKAIADCTDNCG
ncbi:HicA-like toxin [Gordonia phage Agueybana]|uniref:HicA-like toxin n=1 Tax=Gordonia phage Agueybana TaxID=2859634 RepID=A0AC61N9N8_9CAUD|nr:HicA-like toxin [Gordonia phage Agueybana]QYC54594.1 HicA-like toxin [Gordonia phage Agueybana]